MPAAAVIPAPIAYIKVVAVKKLVVGLLGGCSCPPSWCAQQRPLILLSARLRGSRLGRVLRYFTLRKLECFRQAWSGIH